MQHAYASDSSVCSPPSPPCVCRRGRHYDTQRRGQLEDSDDYAQGLTALLDVLTDYSAHAAAASPSRRPPLLVFRETFPQHFWTARGDGAYKEQERPINAPYLATLDIEPSSCSSIVWSDGVRDEGLHDGPVAINRIARRVLRRYRTVRVLPAYRSFAQRHDMHVKPGEAGGRDCPHFCYSPLLWDPVLSPFYEAVVDWAGDAAAEAGESGDVKRAKRAMRQAAIETAREQGNEVDMMARSMNRTAVLVRRRARVVT